MVEIAHAQISCDVTHIISSWSPVFQQMLCTAWKKEECGARLISSTSRLDFLYIAARVYYVEKFPIQCV